ncbi:CBO0543 family protein [Brevibacillus sp. SYSU BS000544]|uniref:CBO0543 family protein n=1 Tax=Brevibacillus sp. SYSU BS000544 TaxID=3416443 RepID=UPI003CE46B59
MSFELKILIATWVVMVILLILFVPRKKLLEAQLSFLFMQVLTWPFGAIVVENRLIEYPERLMEYAYRISFTFEFFLFPSISALFNIHFPKEKSWMVKLLYIVSFPTVMTIIEVILEKYTDLVKYRHWTWYWSWITITITLLISYWYFCWFFKKIKQKYQ